MGLELRLLRATTDASTLGGALAMFDAQAAIELAEARADPLKQANLPLLEAAIAAERVNIIEDFARQAVEEERRIAQERQRAFEEAQRTLDAFSRSIRQFIDLTLAGAQSPIVTTSAADAGADGFQSAAWHYQHRHAAANPRCHELDHELRARLDRCRLRVFRIVGSGTGQFQHRDFTTGSFAGSDKRAGVDPGSDPGPRPRM